MPTCEGERLAEFAAAVRESSLKRLRAVPTGLENWRIAPDAMSFADLARHLIDADTWLFKALELPTLEPMVGRAGLVCLQNRNEYDSLLHELGDTGRHRTAILRIKPVSGHVRNSEFRTCPETQGVSGHALNSH